MKKLFKVMTMTILVLPFYAKGAPGILPNDIKQNNNYQLACNFIEHYAQILRSPRNEATTDSIRKIKEDGFHYVIGNDNKLVNLKGNEDIAISINLEDYYYIFEWSKNKKPIVKCSFPANISLLTFQNKVQLENKIIEKLKDYSQQIVEVKMPKREALELQKVSLSNFYVADNGFYITPRLKNQIIYEVDPSHPDSCRMLVDTEKYQLETLSNMMLTGYSSHRQNITVKVSQYGYKLQTIELPLANLFKLLSEEGCIPHWGVEQFDGKTVKGVYLWLNPYGGYAHLLTVESPIDAINQTSHHIIKFHCYLRLDNLKSLFEEYI